MFIIVLSCAKCMRVCSRHTMCLPACQREPFSSAGCNEPYCFLMRPSNLASHSCFFLSAVTSTAISKRTVGLRASEGLAACVSLQIGVAGVVCCSRPLRTALVHSVRCVQPCLDKHAHEPPCTEEVLSWAEIRPKSVSSLQHIKAVISVCVRRMR